MHLIVPSWSWFHTMLHDDRPAVSCPVLLNLITGDGPGHCTQRRTYEGTLPLMAGLVADNGAQACTQDTACCGAAT
jgi:hypothetical protein